MYSIGWPKISDTARKYNKDENLENYDSKFGSSCMSAENMEN